MDHTATTIDDAQRDMRQAYLCGAPGMLVSALAWLIAALVAQHVSPERAVWTLFVGGMLIHPVATLVLKVLGRSARHRGGNPFAALALASTFWLILSLPLAYAASLLRIEWFFPAMLLVIGGRYLTFATMFGMRTYWLAGTALAAAGWVLGRANALPGISALAGAAIEAAFAAAIFLIAHRDVAAPNRT